jgi:cell division septal protein FtsQ
MAKRKSRKQQTYKATSIPIFSPEALKKASAPKKNRRKTTRKRKKQKQDTFLSRLVRSWGFSHYLAFLLIAVSLAGMAFLFTDSSFQAATPTISGTHYLDADLILQQAHLDGKNIYTIDPTIVANRINTFMPQVKKVGIRLGLPNKVAITITEREPVMVYGRGNKTQWADQEGHLFDATTDIATLPVLVDEDGSASPDGKHLNPAIWQAMHEIVTTIPEINQFHYRDVYGLFFISPEGWRVYLGDGENMQEKLAMWQTIRQQLLQDNRSVKAVDLRFDRVYIQ